LYFSPTFAGSRPGALSAACWATLLSMGENGYLDSVKQILKTAEIIKKGVHEISELNLMGDPLWVIAFQSKELDIYKVMDQMTQRGWNLNGLHKPACVHICLTLRHTQTGVAARFLSDLKDSVDYVKANPSESSGMAPVYGMAASLPFRGVVRDFLKRYLDLYYKV
jgi:glutamate/tyrosine decarboxylase-like PLP-dependent enzyme